ncbi:unnamed protein product, partial [Brenthis ino]
MKGISIDIEVITSESIAIPTKERVRVPPVRDILFLQHGTTDDITFITIRKLSSTRKYVPATTASKLSSFNPKILGIIMFSTIFRVMDVANLIIICLRSYLPTSWYGHVKMKDETHVTRRGVEMNVDRWSGRGRLKKRCIDCMRQDMKEKGVNDEMTSNRGEWKRKAYCADPK